MHDTDDNLLQRMTLRELLDFQDRIHDAIRAHIRAKNVQMVAAAGRRPAGTAHLPQVEQSRQRSLGVHARIRHSASPNVPSRNGEQPLDAVDSSVLERERDAWITRKRLTAR